MQAAQRLGAGRVHIGRCGFLRCRAQRLTDNERVREPGGFYLPNGPREGKFTTPSGRAKFTVHGLPRRELQPGELLMMTVRSHDQYNTTIYGLDDRYRGLKGDRRVVLINPDDLRAQGLHDGQIVDIASHFKGETRTARRFLRSSGDCWIAFWLIPT